MALLGGGSGDHLPAREPGGRRPAHRPRGLHRDKTTDAHRRPTFDDGIEVGVWQNRLQQRDRRARLPLGGPVADDPAHHPPAFDLNHLEIVFTATGNRDPALAAMDAQNPGEVMTLWPSDADLPVGQLP